MANPNPSYSDGAGRVENCDRLKKLGVLKSCPKCKSTHVWFLGKGNQFGRYVNEPRPFALLRCHKCEHLWMSTSKKLLVK